MPSSALVDTSAILALLDRDDREHQACVDAYQAARLPLLTTEAVLTEAFHLVDRDLGNVTSLWILLRAGALKMMAIQDEELPEIHSLLIKYQDRPMDFADATLVYLATRESVNSILTLDRDDFETYRIGGVQRFNVLPVRNRR